MIEVISGVEKAERGLIAVRFTLFEGMRGQLRSVQWEKCLAYTVYRVLKGLSLNLFKMVKYDAMAIEANEWMDSICWCNSQIRAIYRDF